MLPPTLPATLLGHLDRASARSEFARAFLELLTPAEQLDCLTLLSPSEPLNVGRGQVLFGDGKVASHDDCVWILEGAVEEWKGNFRMSRRLAGDLVGELPALLTSRETGRRRARPEVQVMKAITRDPTLIVHLKGPAVMRAVERFPAFARALLRGLAAHARDLADDEGQLLEATEEFFPRGFGQLTPGPYDCRDVTMHILPLSLRKESADHPMNLACPPGVKFIGETAIMAFVQMRDVRHPGFSTAFNYDEVAFFIPCLVDGRPVLRFHVPFIFADNVMAVFLGREIAGLPKLQVSTFIDTLETGEVRLMMRRNGRTDVDLRGRPADFAPSLRGLADAPGAVLDLLSSLSDGRLTEVAFKAAWEGLCRCAALAPTSLLELLGATGLFSVRAASWKRVFHPATAYVSSGPGQKAWTPETFQVDALCETPFRVTALHEIEPMSFGLDGLYFGRTFPGRGLEPLSPLGLRVKMSMIMETGSVLLDYRTESRFEADRRLRWGPTGRGP